MASLNPLHFSSHKSVYPADNTCRDPILRREWRSLALDEQQEYIAAVKCLSSSPSRMGLSTTRYDDFVFVHISLYDGAHKVAQTLPWHRYYINIYEKALREECGYSQYLPYWDWTLDALDPERSPIWSSDTGFGGNGEAETSCVRDGPFRSFAPQYPQKHCLQRDFTPGLNGFNYTKEIISNIISEAKTYADFRENLEMGPHNSIHNGIGGEMPTDGSSNDPIFFVHHAQIDRLWWTWQNIQPDARLQDYSGPLTAEITNATNMTLSSLQDKIIMLDLAEDKTVRDLMSTESDILCYRY